MIINDPHGEQDLEEGPWGTESADVKKTRKRLEEMVEGEQTELLKQLEEERNLQE